MNESVLKALMKLFAILANVDEEGQTRNDRTIVYEYLHRQFSNELVTKYLLYFDDHIKLFNPHLENWDTDAMTRRDVEKEKNLIALCRQLNEELRRDQKILVIVHLLDFIYQNEDISDLQIRLMNEVAETLLIDQNEYNDIINFTLNNQVKIKHKENLLSISSDEKSKHSKVKHLYIHKLEGTFYVLRIRSTNTFIFRYYGDENLTLNGHFIRPNRSFIWYAGSVIKNSKFGSIYYTWMVGKFIEDQAKSKFVFTARNVEYSYGSSDNGIKKFTLNEESGRLIGIIGGSGSGKSTLLKVLNGTLRPRKGSIKINGIDIHDDREELKGIIGYVPQDDVLIKELTVYQNLYYNAKLSLSKYSEEEIREMVEQALINFDLVEARDLKVGDSINTYLSGGQRKRLNIALELIREPSILFVDEPTSGLSSADSEKVMNMLKRQTFKGKLIFSILHQPSSDVFKLLDKLLVIDQGGRVIYYGNPVDTISYFKRMNQYVDAEESECLTCGNINTDQILRSVESRMVDVNGRLTRKRKTTPQEWYDHYMKNIDPIIKQIKRPFTEKLPRSFFSIPKRFEQIKIYFIRDIISKLANRQYLIINLLEAPILAIILGFFTKSSQNFSDGPYQYIFGENVNINGFLFMSVIVSLFMGLVISAEEIFRDRKILERERFLNLSRFSYLQSKILILFMFSAIQTITFVIIGSHILEIREMWPRYFLILFSTACWANMVGLNISSGFNSVVTIYILIPLVIVPQLLLSGTVIDFNDMNPKTRSVKYVPILGDMMTSRWSYEALAVTQYKDNPFERHFYEFEKKLDNTVFNRSVLIPVLKEKLDNTFGSKDTTNILAKQNNLKLLNNEFLKINNKSDSLVNGIVVKLNLTSFDSSTYGEASLFLKKFDHLNSIEYRNALYFKEKVYESFLSEYKNIEGFTKFKNKYYNKQLATVVLNNQAIREYTISNNEIIRLKSPIYNDPLAANGRAHFFAPFKQIGKVKIDTFWFNIFVLWIYTLFFYVALYYEWIRKVMEYGEHIKLIRYSQRKLMKLIQGENYKSRDYY